MIYEWVKEAFGQLAGDIAFYLTFQFLDPFWGWAAWLALLYVIVLAICYFFGTFWPTLRVIGGVLLLIATFGLFAYARGEREARAHDKPKTKPKPPPTPQAPPSWWW